MVNNKTGFDYYNVDTDRYQDIKIKRLKKDCGPAGIAVYDYILCEIYRVRGCFLEWDENTAFDVAEYFGLKESRVNDIVNYCAAVGLFDIEVLRCESVLTSRSIQQRFTDMSVRAKRKNFKIPNKINKLTEESPKLTEESPKLTEESPKLTEDCRKEKKSKVKESKVKGNIETTNVVPNSQEENFPYGKSKKAELSLPAPTQGDTSKQGEKVYYGKLMDYYNTTFAGKLPAIRSITDERRKAIHARIAQHGKEAVMQVFTNVKNSTFLLGGNDRNWRCDFDWIFKQQNFIKILEGNYNGKRNDTKAERRESVSRLKDLAGAILRGTSPGDD